jgi:hypothetical protein
MRLTTHGLVLAALLAALGSGCADSIKPADSAAPHDAQRASAQTPTIDHVSPRRDASGDVPARFEWTRVDGAEHYTIGLWNEVDTMVWRHSGIAGTSVPWPPGLEAEPGTYYWSVAAIRDGRPIAESGLAAFIIRTDQ